MSDFLFLGKVSFFQHVLFPMVCFWSLNSMTLGTVCTYICRNNVYVSQNRHFLKAVNLKVKLIQPIFSVHLLTLLMCMLNRRSQIWVSLAKRPKSANECIQSQESLANSTVSVEKADWEVHFSQRWWYRRRKACDKAVKEKLVCAAQGQLLCSGSVSQLLHFTDVLLRKFSFVPLIIAQIPVLSSTEREAPNLLE